MSDAVTRLNAALEGRYTIERELGEGGMATVYLARDEKHNRNVALKVLKPELAAVVGAERFLAEIETTASLQHPHILPLFDSGQVDGFLFYVMPYVEGETLRERLDRDHQLPVDEAVRIATNVAEALDYAHQRGVVHRDIKPANILLQAGKPVISDFGIALAVGVAGGGRLTETGLSLGTPHYMSPEQATGDQSVGVGTDIYALGCVLYEMLVGEPPYTGSTAQAVLGKIIQARPVSATEARPSVPANVDAAIRRALEKVSADRFSRVQDLARALDDPGFRHGEPVEPEVVVSAGPWKRLSAALAALAAVLGLGLGWSLLAPDAPTPLEPPKRFEIRLGPTELLNFINVHAQLALSRDGRQLVYVTDLGDGPRLYVRPIDQLDARALPGTEGAVAPFFSPDGQWVAYHDPAQQSLEKVSVQGGQPLTLAAAFGPLSGTWLEDGTIVYPSQAPGSMGSPTSRVSLWRVPDAGGTPEPLTTLDAPDGVFAHGFPQVLPGGRAVLFAAIPQSGGEGRIMAVSLDTGELSALVEVGYAPHYSPTGHLIFARQGALWAVGFDPERLETTGQEVVVLQGLEMSPFSVAYTFAPDGLLVYMPGRAVEVDLGDGVIPRSLVWVDRDGREELLPLPVRQYRGPKLSPDGTRVAVAVFDGQGWDLWVYDVRSGASLRLTQDGSEQARVPVWTPDGERIVYRAVSADSGSPDLYWIASDGSADPEQLLATAESTESSLSISPDGRTLMFSRILDPGDASRREIVGMQLEGEPEETRILEGRFNLGNASISPDGRWLAYYSDESGQIEVYLQPYPGPGAKTPVSIGGGEGVRWSADGTELFYRSGLAVMAVSVQTEPALTVGQPRTLFEGVYFSGAGGLDRQYDVAPDGRFLMIKTGTVEAGGNSGEYDRLIVVENWLDELRRLVPN